MARSRLRLPASIRLLIVLGSAGAVLAGPATVAAHAQLDTIDPADGSSGPAPTAIVGTFTQNLDPAKSSFALVDAGGAVVAKGGAVGSDPRRMSLALATTLAPGAYTVRWTSVSTEDGETARGTTTFTVIPPASVPPSVPPSASPSASAAAGPSTATSAAPSASPAPPAAPTSGGASGMDALIPIAAALIVLAVIGAWLLRGRGRGRGAR